MRFVFLLVATFILLLTLYYVTVVIHIIHPIFSHVTIQKSLIPFYGWRKWWKQLGVILIAVTLFTSCALEGDYIVENTSDLYIYFEDTGIRYYMRTFNMDGHLWYTVGDNILHHPDCECLNRRRDTVYVTKVVKVKEPVYSVEEYVEDIEFEY